VKTVKIIGFPEELRVQNLMFGWSLGFSNFFGRTSRQLPSMSAALSQKEKDIQMMLACATHLGSKNADFQMAPYIFKRRNDGQHTSRPYGRDFLCL
jgi:hypothetical protein